MQPARPPHAITETVFSKAEYAMYEAPLDPQDAIHRQLRQLKRCARRSEYRTRQLTRDIVISKELLRRIQIQNKQAEMIKMIRRMEGIKRIEMGRLRETRRARAEILEKECIDQEDHQL